jgi:hypothetical protein
MHWLLTIFLSFQALALIGGRETRDRAFRAVVPFVPGLSGYCSGTFIKSRFYLTALHCLYVGEDKRWLGDRPLKLLPFADKPDHQNPAARQIKPEDFVVHTMQPSHIRLNPSYRFNGDDAPDIAIIEFRRPQNSHPMPVWKRDLEDGDKVTMSGYGCTRLNGPLRGVSTFRIKETKIGLSDGETYEIANSFGTGLCPGDSGGPLMVRTRQGYSVAAVNSNLTGIGIPGIIIHERNIYAARLSGHQDNALEWLLEVVSKNSFASSR